MNRLSARSQDPLERLATRLKVEPTPGALSSPTHTILIHGYQNTEERATRSYRQFEERLLGPARITGAVGEIWDFHWPGDHSNKLVSVGTYPIRVETTSEAARLLVYDFLASLQDKRINLIAHSLGCRVALETVRLIRQKEPHWTGGQIGRVVLLAAAVPQALCQPQKRFAAATAGSIEHAFYSRRDHALGRDFDLGQSLVGEPGEAVGRTGLPERRWDECVETPLGHSEYWNSERIAAEIGALLDLGLRGRWLSVRHVATLAIAQRQPWSRSKLSRVVQRRRL